MGGGTVVTRLAQMNRDFLTFALLAPVTAAAMPEPDLVFYGHVTRSPLNTAYLTTGVKWSLSGNAQALDRTSIEDPTATTP